MYGICMVYAYGMCMVEKYLLTDCFLAAREKLVTT